MKNKSKWFFICSFSLFLLSAALVMNVVPNLEDREKITEELDFLKSSAISNPVDYEWNRTWGDGSLQYSSDIITDSNNNIFTTGTHNHDSIFLLKYSDDGTLQWSTIWNDVSNVHGISISLDSNGDIYVAGVASSDVILVKFNETGDYVWHEIWGKGMEDNGFGIVIDNSDYIYIAGFSESAVTMSQHILLLKYSTSGSLLWNTTWTDVSGCMGYDIALDSVGNIYVTGEFNMDLLLVKFNPSGQYIWHETWGFDSWDTGKALVIDSSNNIYVTGSRYESNKDTVLLKYDSSGNRLWNRTWLGPYTSIGVDIALDSLEDVYITGNLYSGLTGNSNFTLVKYNKYGDLLWQKIWGGDDSDHPYAITLDSNNDICMAGITESGGWDSCIVKYKSLTQVLIYSPQQNEFFGANSPQFNINVLDLDINTTWYSLDNGLHNFTFTGLTGTINQTEWDKYGEITVNITFYANNSAGYTGFSNVSVMKDLTAPISSIEYIPHDETPVVNSSTLFTITTDDGMGSGVDIVQYKIDSGNWIVYNNPFNLYNYEGGDYNISFRAIDLAGNIEDSQSIVVQLVVTRTEPGISGYTLIALLSMTFFLSVAVIRKKLRKAKII